MYGFSWACVFAAAACGVLFALYRNDVLLALARDAGAEERYLRVEKFLLGSPGWGTPRSVHGPGRVEAVAPFTIAHAELERVAPAEPSGQAGFPVPTRIPDSGATNEAHDPKATSEGVAIVSLDALPVQSPPPGPVVKEIAPRSRPAKAPPTPVDAPKAAPEPVKKATPAPAPAANVDPLKAAMRSAVLKESGQGP